MNGELERIRKEAEVSYSRYCPGIYLEGLRNTMRNMKLAGVPAEIRMDPSRI
jgi:hypothetical protein